jgi:hypothetical protein
MANQWYARVGNVEHGPMSPEALKQLALQGKVTPDTPVRSGVFGVWVLASAQQWLFATTACNTVPPPMPTPIMAGVRGILNVRREGGRLIVDLIHIHEKEGSEICSLRIEHGAFCDWEKFQKAIKAKGLRNVVVEGVRIGSDSTLRQDWERWKRRVETGEISG